jgi:hypothetical protein
MCSTKTELHMDQLSERERARRQRQRQASHAETARAKNDGRYLWGAAAIAAYLGCKRSRVYALIANGALDSAVKHLGHRVLVASIAELDKLMPGAGA